MVLKLEYSYEGCLVGKLVELIADGVRNWVDIFYWIIDRNEYTSC